MYSLNKTTKMMMTLPLNLNCRNCIKKEKLRKKNSKYLIFLLFLFKLSIIIVSLILHFLEYCKVERDFRRISPNLEEQTNSEWRTRIKVKLTCGTIHV